MANTVSFIVQLRDQFSAVSRRINRNFREMQVSANAASAAILESSQTQFESLNRLGKKIATTGAVMTAGLTVPIGLMMRGMVRAASEANETINKFNAVFDDVAPKANRMADDFAKSFGVGSATARKMLGDTGDLLVGFGFTGDAAITMSDQVARLASDLTSFQNFAGGAEGANVALTKALLGESESAKALGIVIRQGTPEFKKNVKVIMQTQKVTLLQAKAIEILRIATKQSGKAIGDVKRTWNDYASVVRRNEEATRDVSESFGLLLLPIATKLINKISALLGWINNLSPATKKLVLILAAVVAIGGPLLLLLGGIAIAISLISLPMLVVGAAIMLLIVAGAMLAANWENVVGGLKALWQDFADFISGMVDTVSASFTTLWESNFVGSIKNAVNSGIRLLNEMLGPLSSMAEFLGLDISGFKIPEFDVNVNHKMDQASALSTPLQGGGGSINGQIVVSASPGSQVRETKLATGGNNFNVGMNMAGP